MNKVSVLIVCFVLCGFLSKAQSTIVISPDSSSGKDAIIFGCIPCGFVNLNYGSDNEISAISWTFNSTQSDSRSLLEFDLSIIPVGAVITDAKLDLYHNPQSNNIGHSTLSGSNACYLRRITQAWSENTVTWNNQPTTTSLNQVQIPISISDTQSYTNIDVTNLINDIYNNPNQSHGIMMSLQTESPYRSMVFASSDHPSSLKRPKLTITYNLLSTLVNAYKLDNSQSLRIYPNPTNDFISLEFNRSESSNDNYSICDALGNIVMTSALINSEQIEVKKLNAGVYYLTVKSNNKFYKTKFIKL